MEILNLNFRETTGGILGKLLINLFQILDEITGETNGEGTGENHSNSDRTILLEI